MFLHMPLQCQATPTPAPSSPRRTLRSPTEPAFRRYAHQVVANAKALAEALTARGYDPVTGGTDNHLIRIDLTNKGVAGTPVGPGQRYPVGSAGLPTSCTSTTYRQASG